MQTNDQVLDIVRAKGPMLPIQVVRELGGTARTNTFIIGAILSELLTAKKIRISSLKVGGSPVYFAQGQEQKLQDYHKYLHEREIKVYELLKEHKILRDRNMNSVERVCLRNIKDFAKPLEVTLNDKEIFWKWYLLPNSDAEGIIRDLVKNDLPNNSSPQSKQSTSEVQQTSQNSENNNSNNQTQENKYVESNSNVEENNSINSNVSDDKVEKKVESKSTESNVDVEKKEIKKEEKFESKKNDEFDSDDPKETQSKLSSSDSDDPYMKKILNYFSEKNINITEKELVKKDQECEFIIRVPSAIGRLTYFCIAKNKKKCTDTDLSLAYVKAQQKNIPLLFICSGEMSKKGLEVLEKELRMVKLKYV